jgi:addiction module HigA family antidote
MKGKTVLRVGIHPGVVLKDELGELGITPTELARRLRVPPNRVTQLIQGKRGITADTALRLGHWFGTNPQFWMNLQAQLDLVMAERAVGKEIRGLPRAAGAAA